VRVPAPPPVVSMQGMGAGMRIGAAMAWFGQRLVFRSVSRSVSRLVKPRQRRRLMASQHGFAAPTRRACASPGGVYAGDGRWHAHWGGHGLVWPKIGVQVHV